MTRPPRPSARRRLLPRAALLLLAAVLVAATAPPARADPGWRWPLDPEPPVLAGFRAPAGPYAAGHRGADLQARVGQAVLAAGAGVVAYAGRVAGRGVVSVVHPDGRRTTYEPVTPSVVAGAPVGAGTRLGVVSAAPGHCLPVTCLHWGLRVGASYLDPLTLLGRARVRLLPVWSALAPAARGLSRTTRGAVAHRTGRPDRGPLLAGLQQ